MLSNQAWGQFGIAPFTATNTVQPTYIIDIVGGSAQNATSLSYAPSDIFPAGTTIAWFNDNPGQPQTVTSGLSNSSDIGI